MKIILVASPGTLCFGDEVDFFDELIITDFSVTLRDDKVTIVIHEYEAPGRYYGPPGQLEAGDNIGIAPDPNKPPKMLRPLGKFKTWKEIEDLSDEERGELLLELNKSQSYRGGQS